MRLTGFAAYVVVALAGARSPHPNVAYELTLDAGQLDVARVAVHLAGAPESFHLAMKIHPEYNSGYWRSVDSVRVDGERGASVTRMDSTLWSVVLPGGSGTVRYRLHIAPVIIPRRAWQSFASPTGALINEPDFFLYVPELATAPVSVSLSVPADWHAETALTAGQPTPGAPMHFTAPGAAALLDAPILLGAPRDLHRWSFVDRGTTYHVGYWQLPNATPFDTAAFVDELRRLTQVTTAIFGGVPAPAVAGFHFLIQDGANDALEHAASVTIGVLSAALASNPRAALTEITHEFFHTWNLVAIHPDDYGALSFRPAHPTSGLWWGEGVTLYYADALPRRAGLTPANDSRAAHLERLLGAYQAAPWRGRVSPEAASLAFGDSPARNPQSTGSYYLQGELLAQELDAIIRDSTAGVRGLDDVMRALFAASADGRGFASRDLEGTADSMCACQLDGVFERQVRGSSPIDVAPLLNRVGMRLVIDTVAATDSMGAALPDLRIGIDGPGGDGRGLTLIVTNPASIWARAGLRTGDQLVRFERRDVPGAADFWPALRGLRVGDSADVTVRRDGERRDFRVPVTGYLRPRARLIDAQTITAGQRTRRERWLAGW
ncbi:MAG TPA: PDZ domain-containing protein [Gemmatimonadaceae bacterium]